jgi:hypothetical protein
MPEFLLGAALIAVIAYALFVSRTMQRSRQSIEAAAEARLPDAERGYLLAARDHYRRLTGWARLFEQIRNDDMVWPVMSQDLRTTITRELDEFYQL